MHQLQRSWVRSQHPSAQWNLRAADEAVPKIERKNIKIKIPPPPPPKKMIGESGNHKPGIIRATPNKKAIKRCLINWRRGWPKCKECPPLAWSCCMAGRISPKGIESYGYRSTKYTAMYRPKLCPNTDAGVLKKLSLAGLAKLIRLRYSWIRYGLDAAGYRELGVHNRLTHSWFHRTV